MSVWFYEGFMIGLFVGVLFTYALMDYYRNEHQKARESWEAVTGKDIIFSLRAGKRFTRSGRSVFHWGELRQGKVDDVRGNRRLVKINGHWYKWGEVQLVDVVKVGA